MIKQIVKFSIVGIVNTAIDFGILNFLIQVFSWNVLPANTVSFSLAVINSYFLNKCWTFRDRRSINLKQFSSFILVSLIGLGLSNILIYYGMWFFNAYDFNISFTWQYNISKAVSAIIVLAWNFLASKFWVFYDRSK